LGRTLHESTEKKKNIGKEVKNPSTNPAIDGGITRSKVIREKLKKRERRGKEWAFSNRPEQARNQPLRVGHLLWGLDVLTKTKGSNRERILFATEKMERRGGQKPKEGKGKKRCTELS